MRPTRILAISLLLVLLAVTQAQAQGARTPASRPTTSTRCPVRPSSGRADVGYRAYLLLPQRLRDKTRQRGPGAALRADRRVQLQRAISAGVASRSGDETAASTRGMLPRRRVADVYSSARARGLAVDLGKGSANVGGICVMPPTSARRWHRAAPRPAPARVRAIATRHAEECHAGGRAATWARFLRGASAPASATSFATNLPRRPLRADC